MMSRQIQAGTHRRWAIAFAVALTAVSGDLFAQQQPGSDAAPVCTAKYLDSTVTVGQLKISAFSAVAANCLQVTSGTRVLYRGTTDGGGTLRLGQPGSDSDIPEIANGADVTGRGHPDLIVSLFTGGAHCCMSHYLYELAPTVRLLARLNDADDDMAHFGRDQKDRKYYYYTADWTFRYWPTCFACSPSEEVILRFVDDANGGAYHVALDKMQKPAPKQAAWNKELRTAQKAVNDGAVDDMGQAMWGVVLDLLYTGHSDLAWKFVDALGPRAQQKPFASLEDFCSLLKKSPYWADLGPTLQGPPAPCAYTPPASAK
jgi:hypothetical protein